MLLICSLDEYLFPVMMVKFGSTSQLMTPLFCLVLGSPLIYSWFIVLRSFNIAINNPTATCF